MGDEELPSHISDEAWSKFDRDGSGEIDFEEFVLWAGSHQWGEEMIVGDPKDRQMRRIARDNGFLLPEIEGVKAVFDKFDVDKSGFIDEMEFKAVLIKLMKVKDPTDVPA